MRELLYRYNPWWEGEINSRLFARSQTIEVVQSASEPKVTCLVGLRRIGKTSILKKVIEVLIREKDIDAKRVFYISLDEYLLKDSPLSKIVDEYRKIHKIPFNEKIYLFFDEVTYLKDYEIQLKNMVDNANVKIFIASSNSMLLRMSKGFLTGRTSVFEILPLTFAEYLKFKDHNVKPSDLHLLDEYFLDFLKTGGLPEVVLTGSSEFIKDLVDDIVYKDIAAVHNVRNLALLKDFFLLLMERAGKRLSINKMASILSISSETAHRYFNYFSDSFLIHTVSRHGKTNEKIRAPKKIYSPDIGIRNYFTGFKDIGSIFENYVFLRIKDKEPSYIYNSGSEIDFITKSGFVLECKFHPEPLEGKQKSLFESFPAEKRMVVRDEISLNSFLDVFEE